MAADLHIHVMTDDMTEDDLRIFNSHTLGSKWGPQFTPFGLSIPRIDPETESAAHRRVANSPAVWVGEVSWLKAALSGDSEEYVPDVVNAVHEIIGEELPVLDDALFSKLAGAFEAPNKTGYTTDNGEKVMAFLREHMGKRLFTVSW